MHISKSGKKEVKASKDTKRILDAMKKGGRVYVDEDPTEVQGATDVAVGDEVYIDPVSDKLPRKFGKVESIDGDDVCIRDRSNSDMTYRPNIKKVHRVESSKKLSANEQAVSHIKAAIDILGKSGKKDDVTKDSIANLATILFDIKASTEVASASESSGKTIKDVIPEEKWAEIELVDGPGEGGGISYVGETLDNFIGECELTGDEPYSELKKAFKECGVKFKDFKV